MVETIKFSQMADGGNIENDDKVPGLKGGENVLFNNAWTFLPPGTTAQRPTPSSRINYRLRFNTDDQVYEYYNAILGAWVQLEQNLFIAGPFIIYTADASIPSAQNLGALANGILKQTVSTGIATLNIAVQGTDYYGPGDTPTFAGMTLTGNLGMGGFTASNAANPVNPQDYATKFYVDQTALTGTSVYAASAATLGTVVQSGAGVGATITNAGVQAIFALDSVNPPAGSNVLIKNTAIGMGAANEGIYTITDVGSVSTNWVLTRATSYDTAIEINNTGLIVVRNGSTLGSTSWYNTTTIVTLDTTAFSYAQFGTGGTVTSVGSGTGLTGGPITVSGTLSVAGALASIFNLTTTSQELIYTTAPNTYAVLSPSANKVLFCNASGNIQWSANVFLQSIVGNDGTTLMSFFDITSAVNSIKVQNSITGNPVSLSADGSDTNIELVIQSKGNKGAAIRGCGDASTASPGDVGEQLSSAVAYNAVSLTSGATANVTNIQLTPGQWVYTQYVFFTPNASTTFTFAQCGVNTVSATMPNVLAPNIATPANYMQSGFLTGSAVTLTIATGTTTVSSNTNLYLVAQASFAVSTMTVGGFILATRIR